MDAAHWPSFSFYYAMNSRWIGSIFRAMAGALLWLAGPDLRAQYDEADLLPGIDEGWSRYASPNFELFSDGTEKASRGLLHDLELLRAVFLGERGEHERRHIPVSIFAFRSDREFEAYSHHRDDSDNRIAGLYLEGPDRATILLRPMGDKAAAREVAFHEYVHHLFRAIEEEPPLWYNEGLAELMAGIRLEGRNLTLGHPVLGRLLALQHENLLPFESLFSADKGSKFYTQANHTGLFYAQSWAFMHYLRFGKHKLDPEGVKRFLTTAGDERRLAQTNMRSLFEECFKMDYDRMEKDLARYVRRGTYLYGKIPLPELPGPETYERTALDVGQARARLAEVALRTHQSAAATIALLQEAERQPADARIYEALGAVDWQRGEPEQALERWAEARKRGSKNSALLCTLARREWDRWFVRSNGEMWIDQATANHLRELLVATIRAEPTRDEAYEMLAWVESAAPEPRQPNINAAIAQLKKMKHGGRTVLALALCTERTGDKETAIRLIRALPNYAPDDWTLDGAEEALARIEGVPREMISLVDLANAKREGVQRVTANSRRFPSVEIPDDL